jgi:hypothetical protein
MRPQKCAERYAKRFDSQIVQPGCNFLLADK